MEYVFVFALGVVVGCIIAIIVSRVKSVGSLRCDSVDEDGPYLFLELSRSVYTILQRKYITLKVDADRHFTQK